MKASPILTVNSGSTSVKLGLRAADDAGKSLGARRLERDARQRLDAQRELREMIAHAGGQVSAVAHRVVHGGEKHGEPARIDGALESEIDELSALAPLHNPPAVEWIRAARAVLDRAVPQIAVFDTAYFTRLPRVAATYAIPSSLARHGVRRYGFHGLAHQALWETWSGQRERERRAPDRSHDDPVSTARVITLQLGGGCSMAAIKGGVPIDTSMGFSPLEGLVMETRSGDVDPAIVPYLAARLKIAASKIVAALNHDSGVTGLAGVHGGMREVLAADTKDARLAVELFCYRARKYVGAYFAALGGCDAILFGGGTGENQPQIRAGILSGLECLGIHLDPARNEAARGRAMQLSSPESKVEVWVIPVDEERVLARAALPFVQAR